MPKSLEEVQTANGAEKKAQPGPVTLEECYRAGGHPIECCKHCGGKAGMCSCERMAAQKAGAK